MAEGIYLERPVAALVMSLARVVNRNSLAYAAGVAAAYIYHPLFFVRVRVVRNSTNEQTRKNRP